MLHETRIVLIEKIGQGDILDTLSIIDETIKLGLAGYIVNIYLPEKWLEDKLIKKVIEANGYGIYGRPSSVFIRHNRYE